MARPAPPPARPDKPTGSHTGWATQRHPAPQAARACAQFGAVVQLGGRGIGDRRVGRAPQPAIGASPPVGVADAVAAALVAARGVGGQGFDLAAGGAFFEAGAVQGACCVIGCITPQPPGLRAWRRPRGALWRRKSPRTETRGTTRRGARGLRARYPGQPGRQRSS